MTTLWEAPAAVAALIAWLLAPPLTIGQVAEREGYRRQFVGRSAGVYTNVDLAPLPAGSTVESSSRLAAAAAEPTGTPRDEAWWRARMAAARAGLERDQLLADGYVVRVSALTREIVNQPDAAQQAKLRAQLQKAMDELDRLQKIVLADQRGLEAIQEEARRQGVPMGWLR